MVFELACGGLRADVSLKSGAVMNLSFGGIPIFRPFRKSPALFAEGCGCFPLVPFGNRMENSRIEWEGESLYFPRNTEGPHYLHGDGWLTDWQLVEKGSAFILMEMEHSGVFDYACRQSINLSGETLHLELELTNKGQRPMLCGLGWHPYFVFGRKFFLDARRSSYWTETPDYLPLKKKKASKIWGEMAKKWTNTCCGGWDGHAEIVTESYKALINTEPAMGYFQIFTMEGADFFCFEPMGHRSNGFANWEQDGFTRLAPGEGRKQSLFITVS